MCRQRCELHHVDPDLWLRLGFFIIARNAIGRHLFVRLHYHLCEYGKFNFPGLGRGRPRATTPEVQEEILEAVNMTPSTSTRRLVLQVNVPHTTVWKRLKEYQLYPYHLQRVQALSPADYELGSVRFSLNMWAGIIGDRLVGPHVLVNRLTGQAYTNFLENTIPHLLEDTSLINRQHIHFLHDGAPAHFSRTARRSEHGRDKSRNKKNKCIRFADDMALLAEEETILKDMLLELNDSCEQYGMNINANKTKTMVIGRKVKKEEEKELVGSLAEKKLPAEGCTGRNDRVNDAIDKLNEDIDSIVTWTKKLHLKINPGKTQAIILGHKRQTDAVKHLDISPVKGLIHHEFIPEGRTVTKELYVETLRRLWDAVRRKRPEKWVENNWFLMHDNAPADRAIIVKNFLARHNITALDHPPYSPDLSPPDYFLFPRLKSHLKGRRFNAEEVIASATRALRRVSQNGFQACFQELYTRWQKCVVAEGNYFEGNSVE
ncbi:hypothetical protein ANN_14719 [Periplaneta americana]|uniref:Reverse transcriptase domain-containing protein n=1 Tax=Periplaneta americana TaxID=6978 RepID=A0ABQ8SYC6_PERAM|nr:hypothetical protein ANN_14719 [Periplaneta americana]